PAATAPALPTPPADARDDHWSFAASAFTYFVPDDRNYVSPVLTADRDWLHLEARYNYEALDTASAFLGWNFSVGDKLLLEATPMLGVVFGQTNGVAPGYRFSLSYDRFELYSEGEYLFDLEDDSDSFFYNWSELAWSPTDWFRLGLAIQRTRAYESDVDIQLGPLLGFSYRSIDFTTYVFNLDQDDPTVVLAVGFSF
ncbi:MAG: hypothetical protein WBD40_05540, partial [Tepidisphaeraceae bacterium]